MRTLRGIVTDERAQQLDRRLLHADLVEHGSPAGSTLLAEEEVGDDVEVVAQREVLVDGRDARAPVASCGSGDVDRCPAVESCLPGPAGLTPAIALISVDLPAPLSPTSATTSPAIDVEVDVRQRLDGAEALRDAASARGGAWPLRSAAATRRRWSDLAVSTSSAPGYWSVLMPAALQAGGELRRCRSPWPPEAVLDHGVLDVVLGDTATGSSRIAPGPSSCRCCSVVVGRRRTAPCPWQLMTATWRGRRRPAA